MTSRVRLPKVSASLRQSWPENLYPLLAERETPSRLRRGTISDRQPLMSKGLAIKEEIGVRYLVEANGGYLLALGDAVDVMMPEQMEAWPHARKHLINRRLPRILDTWQWKGARRVVREEDVHAL